MKTFEQFKIINVGLKYQYVKKSQILWSIEDTIW